MTCLNFARSASSRSLPSRRDTDTRNKPKKGLRRRVAGCQTCQGPAARRQVRRGRGNRKQGTRSFVHSSSSCDREESRAAPHLAIVMSPQFVQICGVCLQPQADKPALCQRNTQSSHAINQPTQWQHTIHVGTIHVGTNAAAAAAAMTATGLTLHPTASG